MELKMFIILEERSA